MLKDLIKPKKLINEKWEITFYRNDNINEIYPLKNKMKNGQGLIFFPTGRLSYILSYKNDKIHGNLISLHSNYCVSIFFMCKDGKHLLMT